MAARKNKIKHDEATKDAIRASQLVNFLHKQALSGEDVKVDPAKVNAAKAVLPFLKPTLSSVEQTNHAPTRNPEEIMNEIRAMLEAKPELLATLLPGYVLVKDTSTVVAPQQTMPDAPKQQSEGENATQ